MLSEEQERLLQLFNALQPCHGESSGDKLGGGTWGGLPKIDSRDKKRYQMY